ncbi:MAG: hypothetical protein OXI46_10140 [Gemmatimonadota bacterium]|nr:hypothetical protein [Gemmatimonadota bacterium]
MADGSRAIQGQLRQLRETMQAEFETTRVHSAGEADKTRQHLGGKLDSIDGKLDGIDGKLSQLVGMAERYLKDEKPPWEGSE